MPQLEAPAGPFTMRSLLATATASLSAVGVEQAGNDARRLLAAALGLSAAQLLAHPDHGISADKAETFTRLVARRQRREPVSRILGERMFYGRPFALSPATLDPRPDSETLIDAALKIVRGSFDGAAPLRILDVGTGSGCLLLTLLCELPQAVGVGTDISRGALELAAVNASRLGVADRVTWLEADALDGVDGVFDLMVCNPPYVCSGDIAALEPEVRVFDPPAALDGGSDGLRMFRRLAPRVPAVVPNGWAVFEVGCDQAEAVARLFGAGAPGDPARFTVHEDVAGMRRCVAWKTRG
jgi:release factor glutamine methyltransferase